AGECLITWKCECPPPNPPQEYPCLPEPVKPSVTVRATASVKVHGSCTRQDGLDRTRPVTESRIPLPMLSRDDRAGLRQHSCRAMSWRSRALARSGQDLKQPLRWQCGGGGLRDGARSP